MVSENSRVGTISSKQAIANSLAISVRGERTCFATYIV